MELVMLLIEDKEGLEGGGEMDERDEVVGFEPHGLGVEDEAAVFQFMEEVVDLGGGNADWVLEKED